MDPDKKSGSSGFNYVQFDIGLGLLELKGTVGPWQRCALRAPGELLMAWHADGPGLSKQC